MKRKEAIANIERMIDTMETINEKYVKVYEPIIQAEREKRNKEMFPNYTGEGVTAMAAYSDYDTIIGQLSQLRKSLLKLCK